MHTPPFSSCSPDQLFQQLHSSPNGLDSSTAAVRIREQRKRLKIESRFRRELKLLVRQFANPLVLLLVVAVFLSALLGETSDTLIILVILSAIQLYLLRDETSY